LPEVSIMSLRPEVSSVIPEETVRIARASFPKGGRYMRLRDELGAVFDDTRFAGLFPVRGRPAEAPWRLALVTLFQFAEGLPDRQAAEAVRGRIDWKYALALPLADPGFDSTVLSEFRSRLVEGGAEQVLLDAVLALARERNLLSAEGRQRTDSTHVLAAVRALNRLECVIETMRHALESLTVVAPDWLRAHAEPDWAERYGHRAIDDRLAKNAARREERARTVGQDGHALLAAALDLAAPSWLRQVPAVETLRRVWVQQFYASAKGVQWRTAEHGIPPSSIFLGSPYDTDARLARKRTTKWIGYKAHLTETCDGGSRHAGSDHCRQGAALLRTQHRVRSIGRGACLRCRPGGCGRGCDDQAGGRRCLRPGRRYPGLAACRGCRDAEGGCARRGRHCRIAGGVS
jgi:transposase